MTNEIKPCPFCQGKVEYVPELDFPGRYFPRLSCRCGYTSQAYGSITEAIAAHNRVSNMVHDDIWKFFDIA